MSLLATKTLYRIISESEGGEHHLKRSLTATSLIALGIGAIIGAGLFSLTGLAAAQNSGPAIVLSMVVAAIGCGFAGLCYRKVSCMVPVPGRAYTYAYATLGEWLAWIIGWDLVLEYAVGASTVSISWSAYLVSLLHDFGINLPPQFVAGPFEPVHLPSGENIQGIINLPAMFILVCISLLLMIGIQESARVNGIIVVIKLSVVVVFIALGWLYIDKSNYTPFIPTNTGEFGHFGISGIMAGAGTIFFAYIGFDAVSTAAQEARNPKRDMPIGIIGSLVICTILYVLFSHVLTGMVSYKVFENDAAPVATVIRSFPYPWLRTGITLGIIAGYTSVILVMLLGQSRVFYSMSRDGLLPSVFSYIHPKFHTPSRSNVIVMLFSAGLAGLVPISNLSHFTSIGTLLAFVIVCIGILVMRRTNPNAPRPYRTPWVPVVPILGVLVCFGMMAFLD